MQAVQSRNQPDAQKKGFWSRRYRRTPCPESRGRFRGPCLHLCLYEEVAFPPWARSLETSSSSSTSMSSSSRSTKPNLTNHFKPANFEHLRRGYDCEPAVPPPVLPDSKRFLQSQSLPNRLSVAAPDVSHRTFQRSSQSMHVTEASWNMRQSTRPIHKTSAGPSETFCLSVSGNNTHSPKASAESGLPDEPLSPLS